MPTPSSICKAILLTLFSFFLVTGIARADWVLDMENSGLSYGSIKKNSVGESNHFESMEGRITDAGNITLAIDLSSVETWADIRNERMGEFFFQTKIFPMATLSGQVDMAQFKALKVGDQMASDVTFVLDLHGQQQALDAELIIMRLSETRVVVIPSEIMFLYADKFNLIAGLKKLQELVKLPSITPVVPLTFRLTFNQAP